MMDLLQSDGWERFQRALGRMTHRVDGVLTIEMPLPFGLRYWYSPRGSFPCHPERSAAESKDLDQSIRGIPHGSRAVFWRAEFPEELVTRHSSLVTPRVLRRAVEPEWTWRTSLTGSDDERMAAMHEKHRYNVRLAERRGVRVNQYFSESVNQERFEACWKLLQDTARRQGIATHPRMYYETMLKTLAKRRTQNAERKTENTNCLLYLAERQGVPVAAAIVAYHGDTATYLHGGSSYKHRSLMAPHLLHWQAMCDAKVAGMRWYDFGGVVPESSKLKAQSSNSNWVGMTRFKMGFGGEAVHHPQPMDLIFRPNWYRLLSWIAKMRP